MNFYMIATGNGNKDGLYSVLLRDYHSLAAAVCMNRLAKLRYFSTTIWHTFLQSNVVSWCHTCYSIIIGCHLCCNVCWKCVLKLFWCSARWIGDHGFSIGIDDVQPGDNLNHNTNRIISQGNKKCDNFILDYNKGNLKCQPGCNAAQTLEA